MSKLTRNKKQQQHLKCLPSHTPVSEPSGIVTESTLMIFLQRSQILLEGGMIHKNMTSKTK